MDMEEVCLGRVMLELPVARTTVTASARVDDVLVEPIAGGAGRPIAELREREAAALMQNAGSQTTLIVDEAMVGTAWIGRYKTRARRDAANAVHGIAMVGNQALRLNSLGDETVIDEIAAAVQRVAQALQPLGTPPRPPANGFCTPTGQAVAMAYGGYNEDAQAQYRLANGDLLEVVTRTNNDDIPEPLSQRLAEAEYELRQTLGGDLKITPLPAVRSAAFGGEAAAVSSDAPGRTIIWRTQGSARAPGAPFIEIRLDATATQADSTELVAKIVGSLRRVASTQ